MLARLRRIQLQKDKYIDALRKEMDRWFIESEDKALKAVIRDVINSLDADGGIILSTPNNMAKIAKLDEVVSRVNNEMYPKLINIISGGTQRMDRYNSQYFTTLLPGIGKRLNVALQKATKLMAYKVGFVDGRLFKNGWLQTLVKDMTILKNIKDIALKGVLSGAKMGDVINNLTELIKGNEDKAGAYARYIKGSVYDLFQQHDAAYVNEVAKDLELNYFIYEGGLVKDSRDFCREHDGHVYKREDSEGWATWRPIDAVNIDEFQQKNLYAVPSYLGYPGYEPLIDRGGYNCRHFLSWITDELADELLEK